MQELEQYLADRVYTSSVGRYFVAIGRDPTDGGIEYDDVEVLGFLYTRSEYWRHYKIQWDNFENADDVPGEVEMMLELAQANDVPLFWIGELDANWRSNRGTAEVGEIVRSDEGFEVDVESIPLPELGDFFQDQFETSLDELGTTKDATKTIPLQFWGRTNLPTDYITLDLDIMVTDNANVPQAIGETKRTDVHGWKPYRNEMPNYYLQMKICEPIGAVPFIVKHQKSSVTDDGSLLYLEIEFDPSSDYWMDWDYNEVTGSEFVEQLNDHK